MVVIGVGVAVVIVVAYVGIFSIPSTVGLAVLGDLVWLVVRTDTAPSDGFMGRGVKVTL